MKSLSESERLFILFPFLDDEIYFKFILVTLNSVLRLA